MKTVNIGIIGLGVVGGGVARLIMTHHDDYVNKYGIDLKICKTCCREPERVEQLGLDPAVFTLNWQDVCNDPEIDIVIEVIGGEHPATEIFETAFANGKHMISANKALLGRKVEYLAGLAAKNGVQLRCEAAAAGGIPVVHAIEHDLMGNEILTIAGIMNGTTNYILSRMKNEGLGFDEVLKAAQAAGYAEANPTADVDGFDAASKLAILSSIGFQTRVTTDDVYQQGIRKVGAIDIQMAQSFGYVIKLLGIARKTAEGIDVRVHPTMIPATHSLANVDGAMNAVFVVGDAVGETMFYGAGAGAFPTASAVVGDVMALAETISKGERPLPESEPYGRNLPIRSIEEHVTRFYIRLTVKDQVGTLAASTAVFAKNNVSISHISQSQEGADGACTLIYLTHAALEKDVNATIADLEALDAIEEVSSVIRIEDTEAWGEGAFAN